MLTINYKCLTHGYMSLFFRLLRVGCFYKRVIAHFKKDRMTENELITKANNSFVLGI